MSLPAPFTLFQVEEKVLFHPVELGQPAFGIRPEGFDTVNVDSLAVGELIFLMIDPKVLIVTNIYQTSIALEGIRVDSATQVYLPRDDGMQGSGAAIRDDLGIHSSFPLVDAKHRLLICRSSTKLVSLTLDSSWSEVRLINLHLTNKLL